MYNYHYKNTEICRHFHKACSMSSGRSVMVKVTLLYVAQPQHYSYNVYTGSCTIKFSICRG